MFLVSNLCSWWLCLGFKGKCLSSSRLNSIIFLFFHLRSDTLCAVILDYLEQTLKQFWHRSFFPLTNYFILLFPVCRSPISVAAAAIFLDHLQIVVKNQWQRHPIENSSNMQCWLLAIWFALIEISTASLATSNTTYWLWYDCDYLTWLRLCFLCRNRWHRRRSRRYNSSIIQMCSRTFSDWLPVYYSRGQTSEPLIFFYIFPSFLMFRCYLFKQWLFGL